MSIGTEFNIEEPRGFGNRPFGSPDTEDKEFRTEGFGDPITLMTQSESSAGTVHTDNESSSGTISLPEESSLGTTFAEYTDD